MRQKRISGDSYCVVKLTDEPSGAMAAKGRRGIRPGCAGGAHADTSYWESVLQHGAHPRIWMPKDNSAFRCHH